MIPRRKFIKTGLIFCPWLVLPHDMVNSSSFLPIPTLDGDVYSWAYNRVIGQGSGVASTSIIAANNFAAKTKGTNVWNKLKRVQLYSGKDINALAAPLKNAWGNTLDGILTFGGVGYSESTGLTGTAASQHGIQTGLDLTTVASINDIHVSLYSRTTGNEAHSTQGVVTSGTSDFSLLIRYAADTTYFSCCSESQYTTATDTSGAGFYVGTRTATNSQKIYRNGVLIGTNTTPAGSLPSAGLAIHCQSASNVLNDGSARTLAFYSLGLGLDATDVANLYSAVQEFQTALGRQV